MAFPARPVLVATFAIAAAFFCWQARYLFLDDAFIHLRIARMLVTHGYYSFNGDFPAYCTSSPLYTALLAAVTLVSSSPFVPKLIGLFAYAGLFVLLAARFLAARSARESWLNGIFLAAVASPLGIRWLTDGMETGLVALTAVVLAGIAAAIHAGRPRPSIYMLATLAAFGCAATLLRVEFSFVVAALGLASLTAVRRRGLDARAVALAAGAAGGLLILFLIFGTVLPDTAIAKAKAGAGLPALAGILASIFVFGKTHVAASTLGIAIAGALAVSFWQAVRAVPRPGFVVALNAAFFVFLLLILWRQQAIQGYRYFVFMEFFLLAFNLLVLRDVPVPAGAVTALPRTPWRWALVALLFVGWQVHDFLRLQQMSAGRGATFERFVSTDMRSLRASFGIGWDVGFIGYFSGATILDANGLVNGPMIARLSHEQRLRSFVRDHAVQFVFANDGQLRELEGVLDLTGWRNLGSFEFPNFSGQPDRHVLLMRPGVG